MNFDKLNINTNSPFDPTPYIMEFMQNVRIRDYLSDNEDDNKIVDYIEVFDHDNVLSYYCKGPEINYVKYDCTFHIEFIANQLIVTIEKHFNIEEFIYKLVEFNITHKNFRITKVVLPNNYCLTIENYLMFENIMQHIDIIHFSNNNIYFPNLYFNDLWNKNEGWARWAIKLLKEKHINLIFDSSNNGIFLCLQRMQIPYKRRLMNERMDIYQYNGGCAFKYKGKLKHMFEFQ